jgi:stearoyl-CoA desaturase (delta-9 desaturase)
MFSWQAGLITFLVIQHFRSVVFTIFVHRGLGHRMFTFNPILTHIFRFYLWFTMAYSWRNWMQIWVAEHGKHHRYSDLPGDPHSPYQLTFKQLLFDFNKPGSSHALTPAELQLYASDIQSPTDWVERNIYWRHPKLGLLILWIAGTVLFGWFGFIIGIITYFYITQILILLSNWIQHKIGFSYATHLETGDRSKITCPIGIIMAGESLHARHHNNPGNPNFGQRWWEIDTGWWYCKLLIATGLMKLNNKVTTNLVGTPV